MLTLLKHPRRRIALLVWGTYLVRTSVLRVYGAELRRSVGERRQSLPLLADTGVTRTAAELNGDGAVDTSFMPAAA